ncbi:MAG: DUF2905 domain-containing protein [Candidatus Omnitrophica bacterium]|nr:DUF2905 domain-containing protein [Candidatus Omnitrophota bacterium]
MGKALILIGTICIGLGALINVFGRNILLGRLPGDIIIKKDNVTFYLPITTCVLLSIILSWIIHFLRAK